jgi:hypothetical protein
LKIIIVGEVRWHAERRAAMATLLSYLAVLGRKDGTARLVWAGHEPTQFVNLFPEWSEREDVKLFNAKVRRNGSPQPNWLLLKLLKEKKAIGVSWDQGRESGLIQYGSGSSISAQAGSGPTKSLNPDPMRIRIHN